MDKAYPLQGGGRDLPVINFIKNAVHKLAHCIVHDACIAHLRACIAYVRTRACMHHVLCFIVDVHEVTALNGCFYKTQV